MTEARPLFTVAIPTRDRAGTLASCLRTCTTQSQESLEILVSDNASTDATRDVVHGCRDPRVRYVNPGRRLSMAENFEHAFAHATGRFVMFLGDDDGLLPEALTRMPLDLDLSATDALVWPSQHYYWPGFFEPQLANCLSMDLYQPVSSRVVRARAVLEEVASFSRRYTELPSPYFGVVRRAVLSAAVSRTTHRLFNSITPDIYSGVAVASVLDGYTVSARAYSLSGQSRHSNGASQVSGRDGAAASESSRFLAENTIDFHPDLVYAPSIPVLVAEALLQARDHLDLPDNPVATTSQVIRHALRSDDFRFHGAAQGAVLAALRQVAAREGLTRTLARETALARRRATARAVLAAGRLLLRAHPLIDCTPHGVTDVFGAARLHEEILARNADRSRRLVTTVQARSDKARRMLRSAATRGHRAQRA